MASGGCWLSRAGWRDYFYQHGGMLAARPVSRPVAFWRGLCRVQEQLLLSPSGRVQGAAHPARAGPSDRWSRPVRAEETEIADTVCLT